MSHKYAKWAAASLCYPSLDLISKWLCSVNRVYNSTVWLPSMRELTFWLQHIQSLPCACAYCALFAPRLVYNHCTFAHAYNAANIHAQGSEHVAATKNDFLAEGRRTIILYTPSWILSYHRNDTRYNHRLSRNNSISTMPTWRPMWKWRCMPESRWRQLCLPLSHK